MLVWLFDWSDAVGCGAMIILGVLIIGPIALMAWNPALGLITGIVTYIWLYRSWTVARANRGESDDEHVETESNAGRSTEIRSRDDAVRQDIAELERDLRRGDGDELDTMDWLLTQLELRGSHRRLDASQLLDEMRARGEWVPPDADRVAERIDRG